MNEPRRFIKSRNVLQAISRDRRELNKYKLLDRIFEVLWRHIDQKIIGSGKTRFVIDIYNMLGSELSKADYSNFATPMGFIESFQVDLMAALKREFPDCTLDYSETKGVDGTILERAYIIDWS